MKYVQSGADPEGCARVILDEELKISRLCDQQTQRNNITVSEPIDWYKITMFIPFSITLYMLTKFQFQ